VSGRLTYLPELRAPLDRSTAGLLLTARPVAKGDELVDGEGARGAGAQSVIEIDALAAVARSFERGHRRAILRFSDTWPCSRSEAVRERGDCDDGESDGGSDLTVGRPAGASTGRRRTSLHRFGRRPRRPAL
jgi:hypothetical protein